LFSLKETLSAAQEGTPFYLRHGFQWNRS